ncbi:MAG: FKBP-type peptidyl-prolyl cis-trans isomerase [Gemmatimonadetes bacterium]|nr:FKBP-type peptidyl-prolyl cis-trans isomerase [Gemmatimonadota bacterium]
MSARFRTLPFLSLLCVSACLPEATLETASQKASYGIGLNMGRSLVEVQDHVDMPALMKGFTDALAEGEPAISQEEIDAAMTEFTEMVQAEAAETALSEGAEYLAENAAREGVTVTESGLQYEVLREGDGATPQSGQRVTVHYRGTMPDESEFDSSYGRGEPSMFGVDNVVDGFSEALKLMKVGGHLRVVLPGDLAYGPEGRAPLIGPNQVLVFEIELLGVE